MTNYVKKPVSILLAILMVVSLFTALPITANAAEADDLASVGSGSVITWSGDTLKYAMSYHDVDNSLTGPDTKAGITVDYEGGAQNQQSGFYNILIDNAGNVNKILRLNKSDSVLTFTSATGNAFITKIVINYEDYYNVLGESASTRSLYVNHEAWSYAEAGSTGNYTLTLEGPAARTVALRTGNHYSLTGVTSINFYITEDLYTTPKQEESGFSVQALEDGGLKIVNGVPSWPRAGVPFIVRSGGKIIGFSQADEEDTTSYTIANPTQAFTFEVDDNSDTLWVDNVDDFKLALELERYHSIYLSEDLTFDSGFEITKSVSIDLKGHSLTCDSSATDKTIRVTGGNSNVTSTGYSWYNIVNGDISGFDKIEVTGGSLTLNGGRYDLPEGFSGNVRLTGGLYKLTASAVNHLPAETDGGWAKLDFHVHDYNTIFEERSDGSIYYINRCDECDDTVSEWTLTEEETNTLIELNGGTLTSVTEWNYLSPGSAKLYLRITEDTYNTAIAAPYNMNADALKMIRDTGILGSWVTHGAWTNYSTENGSYQSDDVDITFSDGNHDVGVDEPMSVTSKNGKNICRAVIHINEYNRERTNQTYVNRGNAIISDDALTVTVTNINSDSFTFNYRGLSYQAVAVESVDLCYTDSDQKLGYVTVSTTPDADNCDGYTANYDYRGRTHTVNFTGAYYAHHTLEGEPTWAWHQDGDAWRADVTQVCSLCGEECHLGVGYFEPRIEEATYTKEKVRIWPVFASHEDKDVLAPKVYYSQYEEIIGPKIPTTRYTLEDGNGNILEYYQDESTGEYFLDLEGSAVPYADICLPDTKVDAVEATEDTDGNIEYYINSAGRYFKLEDGKYIEIPENGWVTHFGESEAIDLKREASVFRGQNVKITCDGSTSNGLRLSMGSSAHIATLNGKRIKAIEVTRAKDPDMAYPGDIYINVDGSYVRDYTPIGGDIFAFSNLYTSKVDVYGDFNYITSIKVWCVDGSFITYSKVDEIPATATQAGTREHYVGSDGNYYILDDGDYIEVELNDLRIPPTGGSGGQGGLTVAQITAEMAANMHGVFDMPDDFVEVDLSTAQAWTGAPQNGGARLIYATNNMGGLLTVMFRDGEAYDNGWLNASDVSDIIGYGEAVYYVTGDGSGEQGGSGEQVTVTASQITADMAANMNSVSDMPGDFMQVNQDSAQAWTGAPQNGDSHLVYAIDGDSLQLADFQNGDFNGFGYGDISVLSSCSTVSTEKAPRMCLS